MASGLGIEERANLAAQRGQKVVGILGWDRIA
jgi:hypothetical protein